MTFLPVALIGNLWNRSPFLSPKKRAHFVYRYAGRDEVRGLTSDSASTFKKKDDEAHRGRGSIGMQAREKKQPI